jgi:large subunit ribosomal protein L25
MSVVLKAEKRESFGSSAAKKIKRAGRIPAVIYSKDGNVNLSVDVKEFEHEYFKGNALTSVVDLEFGDKKIKAIAHKIELDPVSDRPVHVDFLNCEEEKAIRAKPKLIFINQEKSPGLKKGGFLHVVLRRVEVICDCVKSIPEKIEIDAGVLQVGHKVRSANLILPAGVKLVKKGDFLIASIIGRGKAEEVATPAAGAAAAPGAGTTPAKAEDKKSDKK